VAVPSSFPKIRTDLAYYGVVTRVISATQFVAAGLAGLGDGALTTYAAYVLAKRDGTITPPHGEQPAVTAYVSGSGTFTHAAYTAPLAVGDQLLLLHPNISPVDLTAITTQTDKLAGGETVAVHAHADNANWQDVFEWTPLATRRKVHSIWLDFVNFAAALQTVAYRLSTKIDGVNYRVFESNVAAPWTIAMDDGVLIACNFVIAHDFKLEIQRSVAEGGPVNVPYEVYYEDME